METPSGAQKPFIRYGWPMVDPFEDSCGRGTAVGVTLHVFAQNEDSTQKICSLVVDALENFSVPNTVRLVEIVWERTQIYKDDPDTWHGLVQYQVTTTR